jgi:hypothetical protein
MEPLPDAPQVSSPPKPRHYRHVQILLTLGLAVVVFGGAELVVRTKESKKYGPKSMQSIALRDRFTAWRNNPAYGRVDRHINAQDFRRDRDIFPEKPLDTIRIFLTGGSVAYGWSSGWPDIDSRHDQLYDNQTISYYLEEKLNRTHPSRHWEVINAAVVGYQLNLELAQTQSVLLQYHPDAIIYLDGRNDLLSLLRHADGPYDPYASTPTAAEFELLANPGSWKSFLFFTTVWMRENSALFRKLVERVQPVEESPLSTTSTVPGQVGEKIRLFDLDPAERATFANTERQLEFYPHIARQIQRVLNLDGVKAIFALPPDLLLTHKRLTDTELRLLDRLRSNPPLFLYALQELYPELGRKMAAAGQQNDFSFLNLIDVFDQSTGQMFTDDCHLTPEGNRIVVQRLFELLENTLVPKRASAD